MCCLRLKLILSHECINRKWRCSVFMFMAITHASMITIHLPACNLLVWEKWFVWAFCFCYYVGFMESLYCNLFEIICHEMKWTLFYFQYQSGNFKKKKIFDFWQTSLASARAWATNKMEKCKGQSNTISIFGLLSYQNRPLKWYASDWLK